MNESLAIKGVRDSLVLTVPPTADGPLLELVLTTIDGRSAFFKGGKVAIDLGAREISAAELGRLRDRLSEREVHLFAVLSTAEASQAAAANLGLDRDLDRVTQAEEVTAPAIDTRLPGENAILVERTLRSGNQVQHAGHVIVLGDVNPGAEVVAGGNVVVWGRLRGVVHAGAGGDEKAVVCALDLAPTQLRIAGYVALSPEREGTVHPEKAFVQDDQIVAEAWSAAG
jgi:septum site-determining protein MinC